MPRTDELMDFERRDGQRGRVLAFLQSLPKGTWVTPRALAQMLNLPETSVLSRIRDLRMPKYGGYQIERRKANQGSEYRLIGSYGSGVPAHAKTRRELGHDVRQWAGESPKRLKQVVEMLVERIRLKDLEAISRELRGEGDDE